MIQQPCVEGRWEFRGELFQGCTDFADEGRYWCPTTIEASNKSFVDLEMWGYCSEECPKDPFDHSWPELVYYYNGYAYYNDFYYENYPKEDEKDEDYYENYFYYNGYWYYYYDYEEVSDYYGYNYDGEFEWFYVDEDFDYTIDYTDYFTG